MKIDSHVIAFAIASWGWLLRYANNVLSWQLKFRFIELVIWVLMSWWIGILVWLLAPYVTEEVNLQHAMIYVSWMIASEIIKTISKRSPEFIDSWGKKNMG